MAKVPFVTKEQLDEIVKKYPTPFHLYDEKGIRETARGLYKAFSWNKGFKEYFAVKATPNPTILKILKEEGFIKDYKIKKNNVQDIIVLNLKYGENKERVITGLKRISKPGLRVYAKANEVPTVLNGLGIAIISTSKGIMADKKARELSLGGEVLAYIW